MPASGRDTPCPDWVIQCLKKKYGNSRTLNFWPMEIERQSSDVPGLLLSLYKSGKFTKQEIRLSIEEPCIHQVSPAFLGRWGKAAAKVKNCFLN